MKEILVAEKGGDTAKVCNKKKFFFKEFLIFSLNYIEVQIHMNNNPLISTVKASDYRLHEVVEKNGWKKPKRFKLWDALARTLFGKKIFQSRSNVYKYI